VCRFRSARGAALYACAQAPVASRLCATVAVAVGVEHVRQRPSAGRLLARQTLLAVGAEDVVDARLLANDLGSRSCLINDVFS
jgi:hypothetical protein